MVQGTDGKETVPIGEDNLDRKFGKTSLENYQGINPV